VSLYVLIYQFYQLRPFNLSVPMGTLAQLMMENSDEARKVAEFFAQVGLPIHLGQLSLKPENDEALQIVAAATADFPFIGNMPTPITEELILTTIIAAHELGLSVAESLSDAAYRNLHDL
jgi:glycerol dehydrogenase